MRNDYKSWKKGVQRVGKQLGGMITRPLAQARSAYKQGKSVVKNNVYKKGGKVSQWLKNLLIQNINLNTCCLNRNHI